MTKVDRMKDLLKPVYSEYLASRNNQPLISLLTENSNLPGKRANLELASAFVQLSKRLRVDHEAEIISLIKVMLAYGVDKAPINDPKEFVAFCGTQALGISKIFDQLGTSVLSQQAMDTRWRIREAVAVALQQLIMSRNEDIVKLEYDWLDKKNNLQLRAIITGYAHPDILKQEEIILQAFQFTHAILQLLHQNEIAQEHLDVLIKALNYTISVIVSIRPLNGFDFLYMWVNQNHTLVNRIIRNNLKKQRLTKYYPEDVKRILQLLDNQ